MTEAENIVLEHLCHIRGAVDSLREDVREIKTRLGGVERELAQVHVKIADQSVRIDRLTDRVERIAAGIVRGLRPSAVCSGSYSTFSASHILIGD